MDTLSKEFLAEIQENLKSIDLDLAKLKNDADNGKIFDQVFRLVHTIKGTARFAGFAQLESLTHDAEEVLERCRAEPENSAALITASVAHIKTAVDGIAQGNTDGPFAGEGVMWTKMPEMVRHLGIELGKKISFETQGDEKILDTLKSPILHIIHNCADHGIELPQDRRAAGKHDTGRIMVRGEAEDGIITVIVSDDGAGVPTRKIKTKALEKGMASEDELDAMSMSDLQQLVFRPGFSTAEKVTSVSGRGIGLDAVRANIESLGGTVTLESAQGRGSSFIIKIPQKA